MKDSKYLRVLRLAEIYLDKFHPSLSVIHSQKTPVGYAFFINDPRSSENEKYFITGLNKLFFPSEEMLILVTSSLSIEEFVPLFENNDLRLERVEDADMGFTVEVAKR